MGEAIWHELKPFGDRHLFEGSDEDPAIKTLDKEAYAAQERMHRVMACWNACLDMRDPAAEIAALREENAQLKKANSTEYCRGRDAEMSARADVENAHIASLTAERDRLKAAVEGINDKRAYYKRSMANGVITKEEHDMLLADTCDFYLDKALKEVPRCVANA